MVTALGLQEPEHALEDGALLLDGRQSAEGHVPGGHTLPLSVMPVLMHELLRDRPVHTCAGQRAQRRAAHAPASTAAP